MPKFFQTTNQSKKEPTRIKKPMINRGAHKEGETIGSDYCVESEGA